MYCNRLHAWWSTQSQLATLLSFLIARLWVWLQTLRRFRFKDLSIDVMVGAWCFGCCQAHRGLPVGFLLLQYMYSVLFTIESLSLLYLLFISWFICSRRWRIDKLGVFHAYQTSIDVSWIFFTDRSKAVLLLWIIYVISVLVLLCFRRARLFIDALWSPAGKGLTSWLLFVVSTCEVVTFSLVSWVRFGAWLYPFLIFALFLTSKCTVLLSRLIGFMYAHVLVHAWKIFCLSLPSGMF